MRWSWMAHAWKDLFWTLLPCWMDFYMSEANMLLVQGAKTRQVSQGFAI